MPHILRLDTFQAIHPAWRDRVQQLCERTGTWPQSVWRSGDLQACWHECMKNGCRGCPQGYGCHGVPGRCPGANPPGLSFHEYEEGDVPASLAVDLGYDTQSQIAMAHRLAPGLGLHFPIWDEEWHVQPVECTGSRSPSPRWSPFPPLNHYNRPDPWDTLFVPVLTE